MHHSPQDASLSCIGGTFIDPSADWPVSGLGPTATTNSCAPPCHRCSAVNSVNPAPTQECHSPFLLPPSAPSPP